MYERLVLLSFCGNCLTEFISVILRGGVLEAMKLVKLLLECHRPLLASTDEARSSEVSKSKALEEIVKAREKVA